MAEHILTQEELKSQLHYDPITGIFTNKIDRRGGVKAGSVAGCLDHGYLRIRINGYLYYCQRLAFLYMTGRMPDNYADHIDTNPINNAWDNLRDCTNAQNLRNRGKPKTNTSGAKGIRFHEKLNCFTARIKFNYKEIHLGTFRTLELAVYARQESEKRLFGEFSPIILAPDTFA